MIVKFGQVFFYIALKVFSLVDLKYYKQSFSVLCNLFPIYLKNLDGMRYVQKQFSLLI